MKRLLVIFCLLQVFAGSAQKTDAEIARLYDSVTINQYGYMRFKVNNQPHSRRAIVDLLSRYKASSAELKKYRKNRTIAAVLWFTGAAVYVGSIFVLPSQPDVAMGMLGGSLIPTGLSIPFTNKSNSSLQRAVWLYNRSVLTGESPAGP